jgi:3-deoxy-manno-octulosonate cytidylyltransferase (CMP-KDO synthetase)
MGGSRLGGDLVRDERNLQPPVTRSSVVAVIPARIGSQRLAGKPLRLLAGRPIIQHVVIQAASARRVGAVLVATDDEGIAAAARAVGAQAILTRSDHASGSDRIAEAIAARSEAIVLNVQGDEPLVPPAAIDALVDLLDAHPEAQVSTVAVRLPADDPTLDELSAVKVVCDRDGRALYFSRSRIPGRHPNSTAATHLLRHAGLYGYRRETLLEFTRLRPTPLELAEGLEQLRLLEHGIDIVVGVVDELPPSVDTAEDLARCEAILAARRSDEPLPPR